MDNSFYCQLPLQAVRYGFNSCNLRCLLACLVPFYPLPAHWQPHFHKKTCCTSILTDQPQDFRCPVLLSTAKTLTGGRQQDTSSQEALDGSNSATDFGSLVVHMPRLCGTWLNLDHRKADQWSKIVHVAGGGYLTFTAVMHRSYRRVECSRVRNRHKVRMCDKAPQSTTQSSKVLKWTQSSKVGLTEDFQHAILFEKSFTSLLFTLTILCVFEAWPRAFDYRPVI